MKKRLFILIILVSVSKYSLAQTTFQKTFGGGPINYEQGFSVQQTTDGGYIITGQTHSFGAGDYDVYLIKTSSYGDTIWTKTFGGTNIDVGNSVQQTTDGGYIITGITYSFGVGTFNVYLIKTDVNGNPLWMKTYGGTAGDLGNSVQQTADGGYIIAGQTFSYGAGISNVYLIKTNANGDTLWTKTFGGAGNDTGYSVKQTTDGGYIITGQTNSFGAGSADVYLIKTDANGDSLWTKTFGGTAPDRSFFVEQTTDGGYIVAGNTESFGVAGFGGDIYLIKTDTNGNSLWTKTYGGTGIELSYSAQQTTDGGYIITGYTTSFGAGNDDVYLIKTDSNGDSLWIKTFGGVNPDYGYSLQQTLDGGYIITGQTLSYGAGAYDIYLIKTDSNGNSGCNQGSPGSIVTTPVTIVTSPATIVTSPAPIVTTPAMLVSSGSIVTSPCSVGINEVSTGNSYMISPNPSAGNSIISFERTIMKGNVEILNTLGEIVFAKNIFNESKMEINLKNISSGICFVKVFDGEKYYCKKIIIEQN